MSQIPYMRNASGKRKFFGWFKSLSKCNVQNHPIQRDKLSSCFSSQNNRWPRNGPSAGFLSSIKSQKFGDNPFGSKSCSTRETLRGDISAAHSTTFKTTTILQQQRRRFHSIADASPRQMADLEERVWSAVGSSVKDPETNLYLHELGWLHRRLAVSQNVVDDDSEDNNCNTVQINLNLPSLLHPSLESLESKVQYEAKQEIDRWVADHSLSTTGSNDGSLKFDVSVKSIPKQPIPWTVQSGQQSQDDVKSLLGPGLANVSHFLAVYSCKGGVGKSTVAVNLAFELARLGGRVGLLDVDIYGPSLPLMVDPDDTAVRKSSLGASMVCPIEHEGVKLLSLGYVSSNSGIPGSGNSDNAAILRGPMAGRVVTQLLKGTEWGDLDVLILDLPPGTGDVQLTVCQEVSLSFAVGVTTPSDLAIADARKGISMFNSMGIETVAMVENMAYFECSDGTKHYPFGRGFTGEESGINKSFGSNLLSAQNLCQLPISETANAAIASGVPICVSRPEEARRELDTFENLATIVSRELFQLPYREPSSEGIVLLEDQKFDLSTINLSVDGDSLLTRFFSENGALQKRIPTECLITLDPMSGDKIDETSPATENERDPTKESEIGVIVSTHKANSSASTRQAKVIPERVEEKGRVGFEVTWSDGSRFIYRRRVIALAAGGTIIESKI
jgi:Mrp family chromosome partitioning ATPase